MEKFYGIANIVDIILLCLWLFPNHSLHFRVRQTFHILCFNIGFNIYEMIYIITLHEQIFLAQVEKKMCTKISREYKL